MVKKILKELVWIILIISCAFLLRIDIPILRFLKIVFPKGFIHTQAIVEDIVTTHGRRNTIHITWMEYTVNDEKYSVGLSYRNSDKEGESVKIIVCKKFPKIVFRERIGIPTAGDACIFMLMLWGMKGLLKVHWYEPDKEEKKNRDGIKKGREEVPELYYFLKKHKAVNLLNELMMIRDPYDFNNLSLFGLFINQNINAIITETEKEWEKGHKLGYIIIGDTDEKTILYNIKDEFIYSYNKNTFKYVFEAGGLVKYLKLLECGSAWVRPDTCSIIENK